MQEAVAHLRERKANLDKQWDRAMVLDELGIWVVDDEQATATEQISKGRCIVLSNQARRLCDQNNGELIEEQCELMEMYVRLVNYEEYIGSNPPPREPEEERSPSPKKAERG